ncbi:signal peptidase II [Roseovarius salinarum]|uniref:signal peptidase II n=1 Tax=Roseovarius salinarum TaxID=1981892 RepID=UPI000C32E95F|nr:signal peptidase II [Roseovarius salinarum]
MKTVFWTGFWVFLADQVTKYIVVHAMGLQRVGSIDFWPPYLNFRMAWNTGINFGLLSGEAGLTRWILIAVAVAICLAVVWWVHRDPAGPWQRISAGLLVGGALGNVVDRLLYGAVADFVNMSCCGIDNPFSFNVADVAVFAGALGLIVFSTDKKAP